MAEGLLSSDVYSAPRFKIRNTLDPSDGATAYGAATLFLQAIIPDTGALAIPVYMEGAGQQEPTFFDPHHFGFDYNKKTIKIPVKAGKLKFQFGDAAPVERSFSFDGIYTVTFSNDWNRIIDARLTGPLDRVYLQIPTPWLTTATTAAQLFVAIATLGPFLAVTAKRIKQYLVPGGG
jgi:hypothetical protein